MIETLSLMPPAFWLVIALLVFGFVIAARNVRRAFGLPMAAVLVTVAAWYVGDALSNDYRNWHMLLFSKEILAKSWGQVAIFLAVFIGLTPLLHRQINQKYLRRPSQVVRMFKRGVGQAQFQRGLKIIFWYASGVWIFLLALALYRFGGNFFNYLCPYIGKHPGPWAVSGKSSGAMDTALALAGYLQIMVGAIFGVVAALSTDRKIRNLALVGIFFTWPYYILDRTRKSIMAIVVPGVIAWIFLRVRAELWVKLSIAVIALLVVNAWFGFVISHRLDSSIVDAFESGGFDFASSSKEKHQGLNMFEELCWIFSLTDAGIYRPNWGGNYMANLANPIPRVIWPNKPTIGIDYAIARGMGGADTDVGVYATLSNGLIGQGVANFGLYLGPAVAALLMGLWASWLARLDLLGKKVGFIPLYGLGMIITFALGRDITFLDLYPFVFGYGICWWINRRDKIISQQNRRRGRKLELRKKRPDELEQNCYSSSVSPTAEISPDVVDSNFLTKDSGSQ